MHSSLLVILSFVLLIASTLVAAASSSSPFISSSQRQPTVEGWKLIQSNAVWYSICESTTPTPTPTPSIQPNPSPLPQPSIDATTAARPLVITPGQNTECVAFGYFSDDIEQVGWSYLSVETNSNFPDYLQSRAAGMLEGYLSQVRIYQNHLALTPGFYPNGLTPAVSTCLNTTLQFKIGMINSLASVDPYWSGIASIFMQVNGLFEGYSLAVTDPTQALSWFDIYSLQLDIDIGDITTAVGLFSADATDVERSHARAVLDAKSKSGANRDPEFVNSYSHCSSMVKLLPGNADLLHAHTTWASFNSMIRTFKMYNIPLSTSLVPITHESSYPGFLFSSDDWYQNTNADRSILLSISETTNDNNTPESFALIQPTSVSTWLRTIIANRMGVDGPSWVEVFSRYNSGTCDNQWIIVNHLLFTPNEATLQPGLLTITEQLPGMFITKDLTSYLQETSYWSSFNIPYFPTAYHLSGFDHCQGGPYQRVWDQSFRYLLFKELQSSVIDIPSMQSIMMYNDLTNPLQHNSTGFAIAARDDLLTINPLAYGGLDSKITSNSAMRTGSLEVITISGPTYESNPPFSWSAAFPQPLGFPAIRNSFPPYKTILPLS